MTEQLKPHEIKHSSNENFTETKDHSNSKEKIGPGESENGKNIDQLRTHIESEALSSKEVTVGEPEENKSVGGPVGRDLKARAYWRTIHQVQARLTPGDRLASRIIHQPLFDKVSTVAAQTIARPSGILAGSTTALIGSFALLMFSKHNGIRYNYLSWILLFVSGFCLGIIIELVLKIVRKSR